MFFAQVSANVNVTIASLPLYTQEKEYNTNFKRHLVYISGALLTRWSDGVNMIQAVSAIVRHITAEQILNENYAFLRDRILNKYFQTRENLLLTPDDIANLKDTDVIYLEKYGKYFYVNKIENFGAGKLTKVELIKI